jgi:glycerol-1-phosphatase
MATPGLLLLVDLDGVLYRGADPVPGVAALLATRAADGDDVVYVTNNSMWYRAEYVDRIRAMGAPATADRIVSSPRATALYLRDHEPSVRHVLTLGASGLDRELVDAGFRVTRAADAAERIRGTGIEGTDGGDGFEAAGRPDAVVVGLDPGIDYLRLAVTTDCVRAGARFIATNRDPVYPTETRIRPGAGSIVAAVEAASGVTAISIGKPEPHLLEEAARAVGRDASEAIMIGDGLVTDIAAARAVGARSVLMLTGVTTRAAVEAAPADEQPTAIAADADELAAVLSAFATGGPR